MGPSMVSKRIMNFIKKDTAVLKPVMGIRLFQDDRSLSISPKDLFYKTFFASIKNV